MSTTTGMNKNSSVKPAKSQQQKANTSLFAEREERKCSGSSTYFPTPQAEKIIVTRSKKNHSSSHQSPTPTQATPTSPGSHIHTASAEPCSVVASSCSHCGSLISSLDELRTAIRDLDARVSSKLDGLGDIRIAIAQLNERVDEVENRLGNASTVIERYAHTNSAVEMLAEDHLRQQRLSDVVVRGIPSSPQLAPSTIMDKLCTLIGHRPSPFCDAFALRGRRRSSSGPTTSSVPVILRFSCISEAAAFLRLASSARREGKLCLSQLGLGFATSGPIHIFESVTPTTSKILTLALNLKKKALLAAAFTRSGFVHVRKAETDKFAVIRCISDLYHLVPISKDIATNLHSAKGSK